ncbi:MAG TPA: ABC transporter permease [Saprospiraceae bacterium]|nr:ABC transporter permease [Saprospiraceae bacterium]
MLKNYFKIAFRNLTHNKGYSFINLFGLTIGITCCLLIGLYIANELSFDTYHTNADRIWRVSRKFTNKDGSMQLYLGHLAPPFAPLLKNDFPDIEEATRLFSYTATFRHGDQLYIEDQFYAAEPNLFKIFDIPMIAGDPATALNDPLSMILSESTAKKYFGKNYLDQDPIGQTMKFDSRADFKITGIYKDFPYNSHMHPEILASFATMRDTNFYGEEQLRTNFGNNSFSTYLLLPKDYPIEKLEAQFPAFIDKNMAGYYLNGVKASTRTSLHLMPLTDIHLRSHLDTEFEANGDIKRVWIFSIIAVFVLLIACINYMNLSTARSVTRAKEIGVRKVVGAFRKEIIGQFLSESVLLAIGATLLAVLLTRIALPFVNQVMGQQMQIQSTWLWMLPLIILTLAVLTGILAGAYPAFFLSSLSPLKTLKSSSGGVTTGSSLLRKTLVVSQFAISVTLIIAVLVVFRQLTFMQNKELGLAKDHVAAVNFYSSLAPQYEAFRTQMLSNPAVKNITRSTRIPSGRLLDSFGSAKVQLESDSLDQSGVDLKFVTIDHRFIPTYSLEIAAGRNFREDQGADRFESFILNEAAVRRIGWKTSEEAIGKRIQYGGRDAHIIGVLKDFNFESLHQDILPMIVFIPRDSTFFNFLSIQLDGNRLQEGVAHLKSTWQKFIPNMPFDYHFIDDDYARLYEAEQRQGRVFIGFAILAIFIACLGLFGLAAFVAQQRVKEIGVRKVLGASTASIIGLMSRDFLRLVIIALVLASPLAWWFMHQWLDNFAYRINISWWIFAAAGVLSITIAFLTISAQSLKAALANPVESLRSE